MCMPIELNWILIIPIKAVKASSKNDLFNVNHVNFIFHRVVLGKFFRCALVVGYLPVSVLFEIYLAISLDHHFDITRVKLCLP